MHETAVAQSLLATISAEAEKQKAKPVRAQISCGVLNAINDEILCFAFEAISKGTVCDGLKLQVEHKPIEGRCKNCGTVFDFDFQSPVCKACGSEEFEFQPDAPLLLETIEFQTE